MKNRKQNYLIVFLLPLFLITLSIAQEHPEHPKKKQVKKEHPKEHPQKEAATPITKNNLAGAIVRYVKSKSNKKMRFIIEDEINNKELQLKLLKVHKERLSHVGNDTYFACADFKDKDGKIYDLDVFMHGKTVEDLAFRKFHVHKEEGLPRYGWKEEEGVWKRVLPELEKKKE